MRLQKTSAQKMTALSLVLLFVAILCVFLLDQPAAIYFSDDAFYHSYYQFFRKITDFGLGEHYFLIAILGIVFAKWVGPKWAKFKSRGGLLEKVRVMSWQLLASLTLVGISAQLIKFLVGRRRPIQTENFDPLVFEPFNTDHYSHSMPSGHTQVIFTVMTFLALYFPKYRWPMFLFAALIGFSRVAIVQHMLSDVIVGALVGWCGTILVLQRFWKDNFR